MHSSETVLYEEHQQLLKTAGATYADLTSSGFKKGDLLMVVDMQNDFVPEKYAPDGGRFGVAEGEQAAVVINKLIQKATSAGACIVATRDYHPKRHCSFHTNGGPFPPHCVQGTKGSHFFPPIENELEKARKGGADVSVVFKGFADVVDSFGGFIYSESYFGDRSLGTEAPARCYGCSTRDWTGSFTLECSNLEEDLNAPPDVMSVLTRVTLADLFKAKKLRRIFCCGLAMDFCVLDSAVNAGSLGLAPDGVFLVADATRAAHIPGVGTFGSGFLTDPAFILENLGHANAKLVHSEKIGEN